MLIVLNVDEPRAGEISGNDFLCALKKQFLWKDTVEVNIPNNGKHFYFKYDFGKALNKAKFKVYISQEDAYLRENMKELSIDICNDGSIICAPHCIYKTPSKISSLQKKIHRGLNCQKEIDKVKCLRRGRHMRSKET